MDTISSNIGYLLEDQYLELYQKDMQDTYHDALFGILEEGVFDSYKEFMNSEFYYESTEKKKSKPDTTSKTKSGEKTGFFERVGRAVENMMKKINELFQKFIATFSSFGFKNKSDIDKLNVIVKAHPGLKDDIISEFKKGNIELKDVKSLSEFSNEYSKLMNGLRSGSLSPDDADTLWKKAKLKLEGLNESRVLGGIVKAGTVISAIGAASRIADSIIKFKDNREKATAKETAILADIVKDLKLHDVNRRKQLTERGALDLMLRITNEKNMRMGKETSMYGKAIRALNTAVKKSTDKKIASDTDTISDKSKKRANDFVDGVMHKSMRMYSYHDGRVIDNELSASNIKAMRSEISELLDKNNEINTALDKLKELYKVEKRKRNSNKIDSIETRISNYYADIEANNKKIDGMRKKMGINK